MLIASLRVRVSTNRFVSSSSFSFSLRCTSNPYMTNNDQSIDVAVVFLLRSPSLSFLCCCLVSSRPFFISKHTVRAAEWNKNLLKNWSFIIISIRSLAQPEKRWCIEQVNGHTEMNDDLCDGALLCYQIEKYLLLSIGLGRRKKSNNSRFNIYLSSIIFLCPRPISKLMCADVECSLCL